VRHTVTITETYNMKQEALYKAWTTPEAMKKFFDAGTADLNNVNVAELKVDLRVGGTFTMMMSGTKLHHGEYKTLTPYSKIAFTWNSPAVNNTLVTLTFTPKGDKTECTLTHELLPQEWVEGHTKGWTQIFKHLKSF
jgi:uncharacterized protein YndB with AHSA1/START domain